MLPRLLSFAGLTLMLAGCVGSPFTNTWRDPQAAPVTLQGQKVLAVVHVADQAARRSAEDALSAELTKRGAQGVPSYSLFPSANPVQDTAAAKALAQGEGITGVVMMRVVGREQTTQPDVGVSMMYVNDPFYGRPWGAWGMGWNTVWVAQPTRTDTRVYVETRVYSLTQNRLLWVGTSQTLNPRSASTVIHQLAESVARELQSNGVLTPAAK